MKNWKSLFAECVCSVVAASTAMAIDHSNLDEGRPLRLEDAYPVAHGEITLETGIGYISPREGSGPFFLPVEVLWGAFANFHLEVGTTFYTSPREVEGPHRPGDLRVGGLYNFNQETLTLPALAIKAEANFPSGTDSSGTDLEVKGIVTKSVGRLSFHLNAAYEFLGAIGRRPEADWRSGRYKFALGPSFPVGAPMYTRTTVLADVFIEQDFRRGKRDTYGVEAGFRHQLTERHVVDAGIGTEFRGPADRADFFATAGLSIAF